jgi:hypothetical protein
LAGCEDPLRRVRRRGRARLETVDKLIARHLLVHRHTTLYAARRFALTTFHDPGQKATA